MTEVNEKLSRRVVLRNVAVMAGVVGSTGLVASCGPSAQRTPPPAAQAAPPPYPPPTYQPAPAPAPTPVMQTKREAHYQSHPHRRERCGGCAHFMAPDSCEIVEGRISPRGWCRNFTPRA